jgi:predicted house-cleaning noncanonical NTP pyrophosphatase (MazG superfamily)
MDEQLEEKLQEFEGEFKQEEFLNKILNFLHLSHVLQAINFFKKFIKIHIKLNN